MKNEIQDFKIQQIVQAAKGNPGAMQAAMQIQAMGSMLLNVVSNDYGIVGTDLYVLWSDLCEKDMRKVAILIKDCPRDVLVDACSRQDYSGRELVKPYIG